MELCTACAHCENMSGRNSRDLRQTLVSPIQKGVRSYSVTNIFHNLVLNSTFILSIYKVFQREYIMLALNAAIKLNSAANIVLNSDGTNQYRFDFRAN